MSRKMAKRIASRVTSDINETKRCFPPEVIARSLVGVRIVAESGGLDLSVDLQNETGAPAGGDVRTKISGAGRRAEPIYMALP